MRLPSRADHVGSLLRPAALREARRQHAAGTLSAEALQQIEDCCIQEAIRMQEEIGLKAVTDGEYRRAFWHYDFLAGLDGVDMVEIDSAVQFSGARQLRPIGPAVTGKLDYTTDHMVDHFVFLQRHTQEMPKQSLPSPTALHYRGGRKAISATVYPDIEDFFSRFGTGLPEGYCRLCRGGMQVFTA
jgi:5-methyltetrahydropteroyltriglutamate--homocysteine methyltransferase